MVTPSHGPSSCRAGARFLAVIAHASLVVGIQQDGGDCSPYSGGAGGNTEHREVQHPARITYTTLLEASFYDY